MPLLVLILGAAGIIGYYLGDEAVDAGIHALRAVRTCAGHCVILSVAEWWVDSLLFVCVLFGAVKTRTERELKGVFRCRW